MSNVKIINPVEGETNEQRIKRCANNLLKALLAGGRDVRMTEGISGYYVNIFNHTKHMTVENIIAGWTVECGTPSVKVEFADMTTLKYESENLTESEA